MKRKSTAYLLLSLIALQLSLSSCATLFTGSRQSVYIESKPEGARIIVDGIDRGVTPAMVRLKKGFEGQTVVLRKDGYETKYINPSTTFNAVAVLNLFNILFWAIDVATGAMMKYDPNFVEVTLEPQRN
jgi:hypothetical protein